MIFLDESGFAHDMPRVHGYSKKGERCWGKHDWGSKGRTNAIGALLGGILMTVSLFETTINTRIFNAWVKPKLPPKSVVIMDNATFHKGIEMQEALQKAGHILLYACSYKTPILGVLLLYLNLHKIVINFVEKTGR